MKKKTQLGLITAALATVCSPTFAAQLDITLTNATKGIYFTPIIAAAHGSGTQMFRTGIAATPELQAMAEGGDISGLATLLGNAGATLVENPASGILNPAAQTQFSIDTGSHQYLSLSAMLLPTNDGFVGLDSWKIPSAPGTYTLTLNSYDAGTEANDELASSMPNPPFITFGSGGSGVETSITNNTVHIHPGNLGDADANGGLSDLDNSAHRWLNPVATVTIVVN
ncbi:spondin domain-containing protein [Vibrio sp. TRT 17S01]|uniref:spondin domain-containing protein n=1 Tax=Vibrio sp. TRT 17S01 TaxID=3418505 RepID=UPI003CEED57B